MSLTTRASSPRIILASASPRRHMLLAGAGIDFATVTSGVAEVRRSGEPGAAYAERTARDKALAVSRSSPAVLVLGADTIVECAGQILEKPDAIPGARRMLQLLSGRTHTVVTAYAIARAGMILESAPITSRVTFRPLTADEIEAYIRTEEPFDKAGAYGIQGAGASFIAAVEGGRDNVMGLPVAVVVAALHRHGLSSAADG